VVREDGTVGCSVRSDSYTVGVKHEYARPSARVHYRKRSDPRVKYHAEHLGLLGAAFAWGEASPPIQGRQAKVVWGQGG
jgi:hypothetical protein